MEHPEFPPNSEASKRLPAEERDVQQITTRKVHKKRKSLRKQFSETFIGGDLRSSINYVMFDVLLPAARDMIVDAGSAGLDKLIFGESRRWRGSTPPSSGPYGHVAYNRMSSPSRLGSSQRAMSRQARARHDFDEIVLESRTEAEQVIDELFEVISRYESATVADLYQLVGLPSSHTDHKWGWIDLRGAGVSRTRDGYLLDLPDPAPLD
jgi:hypothetical protein